jgi:hypothetical protein
MLKAMQLEPEIILAQRIMNVIRESGMTRIQAHAALSIAGTLLTSNEDITFQNDPELEKIRRAAD